MANIFFRTNEDTKEKVGKLKEQFRTSNENDVIERLIDYYNKNHIEVSEPIAKEVENFKKYFRVRTEEDVVRVLMYHFDQSKEVSKKTFELISNVQNNRYW